MRGWFITPKSRQYQIVLLDSNRAQKEILLILWKTLKFCLGYYSLAAFNVTTSNKLLILFKNKKSNFSKTKQHKSFNFDFFGQT